MDKREIKDFTKLPSATKINRLRTFVKSDLEFLIQEE